MSKILSREAFEECVMRSDDGGANAVLDCDAEQRARIAELEVKKDAVTDCYCVCHSAFSSRPACDHCKGINRVSDFHLKKRIAELTDALTAEQERHANMTRLFDESDRAVKDKDARIAKLEADAFTVAHLRKVLDRVRQRPQLGDNLTDSEMAGMVRMLTRDDLSHEMICVLARDRIIALSDAVETLRKERDVAKKQFTDHTKCVDGFLCELYDIMIDPLSDGVGKVSDTCVALKAAAIRDRETVRELREKLEVAARPRGYELTRRWAYEVSCETNVDDRGRPTRDWHPKELFDWNHNLGYAKTLRDDPARFRNVVVKRCEVTSGSSEWEIIDLDAAMSAADQERG